MSDQEIAAVKKGRTKKNGEPDMRSVKSAINVSKARSKVKAFVKMGKQIIENSDSENSEDEIIDLVIRKKGDVVAEEKHDHPSVIRRKPLKEVLKADTGKKKTKKHNFVQPDSGTDDSGSESEEVIQKPKRVSKSKAKLAEMDAKHKALEEQFEIMKKGIIDASNKKPEPTHMSDIDILRKKMILKF